MRETSASQQWDDEYQAGRYKGEPPIPFVDTILANLGWQAGQGHGLYVGCGNGRNYLPLLATRLNLHGMDVSPEGIRQIRTKAPETTDKTFVGDFGNYSGANVFDYMIAIQVFQHGDRTAADNYFQRSAMALKPGGKLFLRVNSISTELTRKHRVVEGDAETGKTIIYEEGPKSDLAVHFYSKPELQALAKKFGFTMLAPLREVAEEREPPLAGTWSQWETIWQKERKV